MSKEEIERLEKMLADMPTDTGERWKISMSLRLLKSKLKMEEDEDNETDK